MERVRVPDGFEFRVNTDRGAIYAYVEAESRDQARQILGTAIGRVGVVKIKKILDRKRTPSPNTGYACVSYIDRAWMANRPLWELFGRADEYDRRMEEEERGRTPPEATLKPHSELPPIWPATWPPPERGLLVWTIYDNPTDVPGWFVLRRSLAGKGIVQQFHPACLAKSIEELRADLPPNLTCIGRQPGDDSCIVEVWI